MQADCQSATWQIDNLRYLKKERPGVRRVAPNPIRKEGRHQFSVPAPPHSGGRRQGTYEPVWMQFLCHASVKIKRVILLRSSISEEAGVASCPLLSHVLPRIAKKRHSTSERSAFDGKDGKNQAPMPSSNEPAASGKHRLSRTYWIPLALVASRSR